MYQNTLQFVSMLFDFFDTVLSYDVIAGITLRTVFLYNMLLICFYFIYARRAH